MGLRCIAPVGDLPPRPATKKHPASRRPRHQSPPPPPSSPHRRPSTEPYYGRGGGRGGSERRSLESVWALAVLLLDHYRWTSRKRWSMSPRSPATCHRQGYLSIFYPDLHEDMDDSWAGTFETQVVSSVKLAHKLARDKALIHAATALVFLDGMFYHGIIYGVLIVQDAVQTEVFWLVTEVMGLAWDMLRRWPVSRECA
ncbi:uncharacterized protein LOC106865979 [Brachypodium distachyon]|uniref:uncharacterized protein LOC106865979 n=1 Tax=Brachypodium distachyon TaxID=15368 RepID=UPI000D0D8C89|nr:uncharacterized protein LOC106865979 [Brachypodium distachyon]|eukprot:XP_024313971.1 uncharacterized protein LOC106865979 [Brachypodium distachyon]